MADELDLARIDSLREDIKNKQDSLNEEAVALADLVAKTLYEHLVEHHRVEFNGADFGSWLMRRLFTQYARRCHDGRPGSYSRRYDRPADMGMGMYGEDKIAGALLVAASQVDENRFLSAFNAHLFPHGVTMTGVPHGPFWFEDLPQIVRIG